MAGLGSRVTTDSLTRIAVGRASHYLKHCYSDVAKRSPWQSRPDKQVGNRRPEMVGSGRLADHLFATALTADSRC